MSSSISQAASRPTIPAAGLGLAVLTHIVWGTYPVVSKRLLGVVPPFSLLAVGYGVTAMVSLLLWRGAFAKQPWRTWAWWALMVTVAIRSATNILSVKHTLAIYVQLINLSAPFAVALLGRMFFRETVPPRTYPALIICTIGSVLALGFGSGATDLRWTSSDWLGVGFAAASSLCLALYMLLTRFNQQSKGEAPAHMVVHQAVALALFGAGAGIASGENWAAWGNLSPAMWGLFAGFIVVNLFGGNLLQIGTLARIPTPAFSALIGIRLIAALSLGAILLGEQLHSVWQVFGAVLVLVGVTWYVAYRPNVPSE